MQPRTACRRRRSSTIKLGLAGCRDEPTWKMRWHAAEAEASGVGKRLAAAAYADFAAARAPSPEEVVELAIEADCRYLLLDTWDKSKGTLLSHFDARQLAALLTQARCGGLSTVVAGSLNKDLLAQLPLDLVDVIAVRGAVCRGGRESRICRQRVASFCAALRAAAVDIGLVSDVATRHNGTR